MNLNKIYRSLSIFNDLKAVAKGRIFQRLFNKELFKLFAKFRK